METIVLDHAHDISGRETHRLISLYPPPEFVKAADHERLCGDPETQPPHLYAMPHEKLYPCHTAAATWMSTLFFTEKRAALATDVARRVEMRLKSAAAWFQITGLTDTLQEQVAANAANDLTKLANEDFAIVWRDDTGAVDRHWPLRNAGEVKAAAAHFARHRDEFLFADRHMIAERIRLKAVDYGAGLGEFADMIDKTAGYGGCAARTVAECLTRRASLTKLSHSELSGELAKLAELVRQNPAQARGRDQLIKLAGILDQFDRATQLTRMYHEGLDRPEDILFQITEKVAQAFVQANVGTTTGNVYAIDDLEKLAVDDIRSWLGDEFADAVSAGGVYVDGAKMATIVPTLDRQMAATFDRLMQSVKVAAVGALEPSHPGGLTKSDLFREAAKRQTAATAATSPR